MLISPGYKIAEMRANYSSRVCRHGLPNSLYQSHRHKSSISALARDSLSFLLLPYSYERIRLVVINGYEEV